jgi:NAD(P)-dependent dehydrogenase (short-subunit alcohol dehydrogenase family)
MVAMNRLKSPREFSRATADEADIVRVQNKRHGERIGQIMSANGKVALVTGAGSGIGRAAALALAKEGFATVLAARSKDALDSAVAEIAAAGGTGLAVPADIGDPAQIRTLFATVREKCGRLDVLFNNAGRGSPPVPLEELPYEQWKGVVDLNLTGSFLCAQEAIRMMKAQTPRGGRIINDGSISAHAPRPYSVAYTATKHAITGLTKSISLDCRQYDIACGQIDIGNALTPMTQRMTRGVLQPSGETMVEPTMDVENVARAVVFMATVTDDANVQFMTIMATKMPFVGRG